MTIRKCCLLVFGMVLLNVFGKAQVAARYDIVIAEMMADPTPQVGLPNNEWIELKNISAIAINLSGWRIGDASGQSGPMPSFVLQPDSVVIVCTGGAVAAMSVFGPSIPVTSFPSLDNTGDMIFLRSPQNRIIHSVSYTDAWYQNELKKEGGWTIEMIDPRNPCNGMNNWKASTDAKGGTPGKKNAVDAVNKDTTAPRLLRAFAPDSMQITLLFDEPLDSARAAIATHYTISDGMGIPQSVQVIAPSFDKVNLRLASALSFGRIYTVSVQLATDCAGNPVEPNNTARVGISEIADSSDVVINEILFNPRAGGTDYVEMYNRGVRIINLKELSIANRNTAGTIANIKQLNTDNYLFFPGDYLVITEEPDIVRRDFIARNTDAFTTVTPLPSYNDDKGNVIILNARGTIVDELAYDEKWHFKLISNPDGVALERIDCNGITRNPDNWHSAAASVGYGTPTYKNSQYLADPKAGGSVTIKPDIISPDNDGLDDFAGITYQFPAPGYVVNITVFDAAGRPVRYLQRNALCGVNSHFQWDGLGESGRQLPVGIYIILSEAFNLNGKKKQFKNVIVLARRN